MRYLDDDPHRDKPRKASRREIGYAMNRLALIPALAAFDPDPEFLSRVAGLLLAIQAQRALAKQWINARTGDPYVHRHVQIVAEIARGYLTSQPRPRFRDAYNEVAMIRAMRKLAAADTAKLLTQKGNNCSPFPGSRRCPRIDERGHGKAMTPTVDAGGRGAYRPGCKRPGRTLDTPDRT